MVTNKRLSSIKSCNHSTCSSTGKWTNTAAVTRGDHSLPVSTQQSKANTTHTEEFGNFIEQPQSSDLEHRHTEKNEPNIGRKCQVQDGVEV